MTDFTDDKPIEQITDMEDEYPINHMFLVQIAMINPVLTMKNTTLFIK